MPLLKTVLCLLSLSCLMVFSRAEEKSPNTGELLDSLQVALTEAVKSLKEKATDGAVNRQAEMAAYMPETVQAIRQSIARGDTSSVQQTLRQIQVMFPDPKITELCTKLQIEIEKDVLAKEKAYLESVDSTVEKAVGAAFKAKEPKELDAQILELSRLSQRNNNYNSSPLIQRSSEKARSAVTFLCRWQDYLMQIKSGNSDAANSLLRNLSQESTSYPFLPRSEILNRMNPKSDSATAPMTVEAPSLEGKTLKDLNAIRDETDRLMAKDRNSQALQQFSQNLAGLERARQQQQSGLIGQVYNHCLSQDYNGGGASFVKLRQDLLLEILPSYLNLAESYPAKSGETPVAYLNRVAKESRAKSDWQTTWKSLETYKNVAFSNGPTPPWLTADIQGLSYFIVAQNQEKSGQYVDAVRSYKRILALTGQNLPITETTERLNSIQKEHAEDFTKAIEPTPVISPVRTQPPSSGSGQVR